jgi:hypothetical protein
MKIFKFPISLYNFTKIKEAKIIKEEKEIICGIEHKKITTTENYIIYLLNKKIHREDNKPAFIGSKLGFYFLCWFKNGELHGEDDNFSVQRVNGLKYFYCWFKNGKRHRDGDKPAEISNFQEIWYKNNKIHRGNGKPALISKINKNNFSYWILDKKVTKLIAGDYKKLNKKLKNF